MSMIGEASPAIPTGRLGLRPWVPERWAWTAAALALVSLAAHASAAEGVARRSALVGSVTPEQVTAWVTTACSAFTLILSTAIAASHRIAEWRKRRPRPRKKPSGPSAA